MKYIINTRFNVDDEVWLMDGSNPHKAKVIGIRIHQRDYETRIEDEYETEDFEYLLLGTPTSCYGWQAFASKRELVQSLMDAGDKED